MSSEISPGQTKLAIIVMLIVVAPPIVGAIRQTKEVLYPEPQAPRGAVMTEILQCWNKSTGTSQVHWDFTNQQCIILKGE